MIAAPPDAGAANAGPEAAGAFYAECLKLLTQSQLPFLVGGTFAVSAHTGLSRPVKDIDVFCKAGDYPRILGYFRERGYGTEVEDARWIAKVRKGERFVDVIFDSSTATVPVTDAWFDDTHRARIYGMDVPVVAPTELIWSKAFLQDRHRYDGADIAHLILRRSDRIDWRRLLSHMEPYWEVLLIHLLNFRFIYPTERERIPRWLLDELLARQHDLSALPAPHAKVCRGRVLSRDDYAVDIKEWGFGDLAGDRGRSDGDGA